MFKKNKSAAEQKRDHFEKYRCSGNGDLLHGISDRTYWNRFCRKLP